MTDNDGMAGATGGRLPTFSIIGAAKAGTTALWHYLSQHPQVYLPAKTEPSFFAFEGSKLAFIGPYGPHNWDNRRVTELSAYRALYQGAMETALGDISPAYLYWPGTAENMHRHVPDIRIVALLRDPVDRAYSAYMHARRMDLEPYDTFRAALGAECARINQHYGLLWRYEHQGYYSHRLREYLELFGRDHVDIILYDDLRADPLAVCARIFDFIGVDRTFVPDVATRHNVSGIPRSRGLHTLATRSPLVRIGGRVARTVVDERRLRSIQTAVINRNLQRQSMDPADHALLSERFAAEIDELSRLLGRRLSAWS